MIDESDPAVSAMRAQFGGIADRHKAAIAQTAADYQRGEAENKARQEEVARKEAQTIAQPPQPQSSKQWIGRRTLPRPAAKPSEDGSETGYYSATWMKND